jgi:hypothetical protein
VERRGAKSRSASPQRAVADVSKAAPSHLGDVSRGSAILEGVVMQKPDGPGPSDRDATPPRGFDLEAGEAGAEGERAVDDVSRAPELLNQANGVRVSWGGEGLRQEDGSVHYRECVLNGRTHRVGDTVELRSDAEAAPPFVGRIQARNPDFVDMLKSYRSCQGEHRSCQGEHFFQCACSVDVGCLLQNFSWRSIL